MLKKLINLVAIDMGYGHQRAAFPLLGLSGGESVSANDYEGMPDWEKDFWLNNLRSYESVSRFKKVLVVGDLVFSVVDLMQRIPDYYPFRRLSRPTLQQLFFYRAIRKGLGRELIRRQEKNGLPLVTTFFVVAYMAEYHNFRGDIYCVICDADISRAWAPLDPANSRIKYLAPNEKVKKRLLMYGVRPENIFVTGFPLPLENIGSKQKTLLADLARRIKALDPKNAYRSKEKALLKKIVPESLAPTSRRDIVTLTFAVGGAGAQKEVGSLLIKRLANKIRNKELAINLVAGNRREIADFFQDELSNMGLLDADGVEIIFRAKKNDYFKAFNRCLRETDILWTKPSELSFYSGLGLPIIMSEPVGSQEKSNREWLIDIGAGIDSRDPKYVDEWLDDFLDSGRLARAAVDGFLNAGCSGTSEIEKIFIKKNK